MDGNSGNSLEELLQTVKALEKQVQELGGRLDAMEPRLLPKANLPVTAAPPVTQQYQPSVTPISNTDAPAEPVVRPAKKSTPTLAPQSMSLNQILHRKSSPQTAQIPPAIPPNMSKPEKPKESWEVHIAGTWLPRVGVLFLALALILLARQHVHGPVGKVIGCYILSIVLTILGIWKTRKYPQWAAPVLAGGLAFSYFTSYAMGFVEPMRLLDSMPAKLAVLAANLAIVFGFAQWKKSEVIAGTALVLGYLTTGVTGNDVAGLCSMLALSVIAIFFLARNSWFRSTALAAGATYLSYLYIWKAVPEAVERTPGEAFWFHFLFLSLAFVVYTAAGFVGKRAALSEGEGESRRNQTDEPPGLTRLNLLTILTQTNVAAYIGGMILVLNVTQVYWNQAWLFFFPTAAVCAVLAATFAGLRPVQIVYLLAAVACFTLGVMSAASPMWLPVFLSLQALAMLVGARGRQYSDLWSGLSLLVLFYAGGYLVTGGEIGWAAVSQVNYISFPWWTYAVVTALSLTYASVAEKRGALSQLECGQRLIVPVAVTAGAFLLWHHSLSFFSRPDRLLVFAMAVPAVAVASTFGRIRSLLLFVGLTAILSIFQSDYTFLLTSAAQGLGNPFILLGIAGILAAWLAEKKRINEAAVYRFLWAPVYVWSQLMLVAGMAFLNQGWLQVLIYVSVFVCTVAAGWLLRRAALAKSGFVVVFFVLVCAMNCEDASALLPAGCILLLLAAAYPLATPLWRHRTGDRWPEANEWGQAAVVLTAGLLFYRGIALQGDNLAFASGAWALVCALYAATGRFRKVVFVAAAYTFLLTFFLGLRLMLPAWSITSMDMSDGVEACWNLFGILLVIAAERIIIVGPKLAWPWSDGELWLTSVAKNRLTTFVAIGMLFTTIMALRILPDLRLFYFTGAMVAAAFVWIVLGFLFNEPIYRKSGFFLLCFGIVKGLIWDVLSLKNTVYRQISWAILGLFALAASFLYSKFRGKID